jgi:outer membrane protein assembly factor BamE (lipoprotein component of BamABCDE complex)
MNRTITKWTALALAAQLLAGCGTGSLRETFLGRGNELVSLDEATLGRTSRDEILQRFGAPDEIDQRWFDSRESEVFFYYDEDFDEAGDSGPPRAKLLACEFSKGLLSGYVFQVLGADPGQGFDETARAKLVKGTTTRGQVEGILGRPQGRSLLPTTLALPALDGRIGGVPAAFTGVPEGAREAWLYSAQGLDEGLRKTRQKSLIVFFDEKGIYLGNAWLQQLVSKTP